MQIKHHLSNWALDDIKRLIAEATKPADEANMPVVRDNSWPLWIGSARAHLLAIVESATTREQSEDSGAVEEVGATSPDRVDEAFETFLQTRHDHRNGLSVRQQLWMAFKAGGDFVLAEMSRALPARNDLERESGRRVGE